MKKRTMARREFIKVLRLEVDQSKARALGVTSAAPSAMTSGVSPAAAPKISSPEVRRAPAGSEMAGPAISP